MLSVTIKSCYALARYRPHKTVAILFLSQSYRWVCAYCLIRRVLRSGGQGNKKRNGLFKCRAFITRIIKVFIHISVCVSDCSCSLGQKVSTCTMLPWINTAFWVSLRFHVVIRILHPRNRNWMVLWAQLCVLLCEHVAWKSVSVIGLRRVQISKFMLMGKRYTFHPFCTFCPKQFRSGRFAVSFIAFDLI